MRTVAGRLEWRLPDPSCNIYVALAATLAAGLSGIDAGLEPSTPCQEDLYVRQGSGLPMPSRLPRDLSAALEGLRADAVLRERVGEEVCAEFLKIKAAEWEAYAGHVHGWEFDRYAGLA